MATLPYFKQSRLSRRKSSDITRLATNYKNEINAMTGDYETAFSDWSKKRDEVLAPYNAAVEKYKGDYSTYETSLAAYKEKLSAYTSLLEDIQKNPTVQVGQYAFKNKAGYIYNINGTNYNVSSLPDGYTGENGILYKRRDPGTFTETAPTAPTSPVAPEVKDFDTSQFDQRRAALETNYKREVDERKSAKLGAVARKQARPMLQGASE